MLTLLCSPKPFIGESAWNQVNALRSWRAIHPEVEIIMFGAPEGAAEVAAVVGARLVPELVTSPSGAPSFNAMVAYADQYGRHDQIVYANCDILLNGTMLYAMQAARRRFDHFLLVGERLDLGQGVRVDVCQPNWTETLSSLADEGKLTAHGPTGADYFGFVREMWADLPPVFMGRAMCDQALLHDCLRRRIPVIDGTMAVVNVHQYHGYQHLVGGREQVFKGEDRTTMAQVHGLKHSLPTVADADWRFVNNGTLEPDRVRRSLLRRAELNVRYKLGLDNLAIALRGMQYWSGRSRIMPQSFAVNMLIKAWNI